MTVVDKGLKRNFYIGETGIKDDSESMQEWLEWESNDESVALCQT